MGVIKINELPILRRKRYHIARIIILFYIIILIIILY